MKSSQKPKDEELSVHMHLICFHICFVHSDLPSMLTSFISFLFFFLFFSNLSQGSRPAEARPKGYVKTLQTSDLFRENENI